MKVSIGTKVKEGPWGGGNLFAKNLQSYLQKNGHEVVNDLSDEDIDIILITEPRKTSESSAYTHWDVQKYLSYVNKNTIVVHRLNECDEQTPCKRNPLFSVRLFGQRLCLGDSFKIQHQKYIHNLRRVGSSLMKRVNYIKRRLSCPPCER